MFIFSQSIYTSYKALFWRVVMLFISEWRSGFCVLYHFSGIKWYTNGICVLASACKDCPPKIWLIKTCSRLIFTDCVFSPCLDAAWEFLGYLGKALLCFKGALLRVLKSEICFNYLSLGWGFWGFFCFFSGEKFWPALWHVQWWQPGCQTSGNPGHRACSHPWSALHWGFGPHKVPAPHPHSPSCIQSCFPALFSTTCPCSGMEEQDCAWKLPPALSKQDQSDK